MLNGSSTHERHPLRILVVCAGNRARSQMVQGWLGHLRGQRVHVDSAGTNPRGVHALAAQVMAEVGIDRSAQTPDQVDQCADRDFDLVFTVCDAVRESCPVFPGARRTLHHRFADPDRPGLDDEALINLFRRVRDEIATFCRDLLENNWG